jgi:1-acyl-sn-glycerol-3-phosphate acyltransferase
MPILSDDESLEIPRQEFTEPALSSVTPEIIKRAKEALAAARNPRIRRSIDDALSNAELLSKGIDDHHADGSVRQKITRLFINIFFKIRIDFPERIPTSPVILAPNHLNHIDPFLILSVVPGKPFYHVVGDSRTLYNKFWKRIILQHGHGVLPIDRIWGEEHAVIGGARQGRQDLAELAAAIEKEVSNGTSFVAIRRLNHIIQGILAHGDGLLIFPEGVMGKVEGNLKVPLKRGTIIYAMRSGIPIVPIGLIGTYDLFLGKQLRVRFGNPIHFQINTHPSYSEIQAGLEQLETSLRELVAVDYETPKGFKLLRRFLNHLFW